MLINYTRPMQKFENSQSHCSLGVNYSIVRIQKKENRGCVMMPWLRLGIGP